MASPDSEYVLYSTPSPSLQFSASYFAQLTFKDAAIIQYPMIHTPKTISAWTFSNEVIPDTSNGLDVNDSVPHIDDLSPILKGMEEAFYAGSRSVAVTVSVAGNISHHLYSFAKV